MQSMTGYGRSRCCRDGRELVLELKTVNHRFLDIALRLPKNLSFLEETLRKRINEAGICRGHLDVFVTYQNQREDSRAVTLDMPLLQACDNACTQARKAMPEAKRATIAEMLTLCGALCVTQAEEDAQEVIALAEDAFDDALVELLNMRRAEGGALQADLVENLSRLSAQVTQIAARAPEIPALYRERLQSRLAEWGVDGLEPQRLAQEVALMADRCAIDEELSRLGSHTAQFLQALQAEGETGRKLDFLLQEMNREVNTVGSKASDAQIAHCVVDAKCVIEKLREQVQNVV